MIEQTKIELQIYYGDLMQQLESSREYFEKSKIKKKMEAIEILLEINLK